MRRQGGPHGPRAPTPATCSPRNAWGGPRRRPRSPTAPSRRPRLSESGGRQEGRRPPQPDSIYRTQPPARGSPSPQASRRPRKAPPAPRGKMAPVEQLRHQPWRRARPSAILAPSSRPPTPPRRGPAFGTARGPRAAPGPRPPSTRGAPPQPLFSSRPASRGLESSARLPGRVRVGPRVLGGAPEPGSGHRQGEPRQQVRAAAEGRGRGRSGRRPRALPAAAAGRRQPG